MLLKTFVVKLGVSAHPKKRFGLYLKAFVEKKAFPVCVVARVFSPISITAGVKIF